MPGILQQSRTISVPLTAGGPWIRAMGGNPRRSSLIFATSTGATALFNTQDPGATGPPIMRIADTDTKHLRYHDFGQLVQSEIYVKDDGTNLTLSITELFSATR